MKTSTLVFRLIVSLLFLAQVFYSIAIGVPLLGEQNPTWIVWLLGLFLGFYGAYTVGRYHELEHIQERTVERAVRSELEHRRLGTFIQQTVKFEHVGTRFQELKESFAAECEAQVSFYTRREKAMAKALRQGSGDEALQSYNSEVDAFHVEDRLIRDRVYGEKEAFWNYHELVGEVNDILDHTEHVYARPDSIRLGGQVTGEEVAEY